MKNQLPGAAATSQCMDELMFGRRLQLSPTELISSLTQSWHLQHSVWLPSTRGYGLQTIGNLANIQKYVVNLIEGTCI